MQIVIRADSSARMGSGHIVRCLTLADELRERGASVLFLSREHVGNFNSRIEAQGFRVARLQAPARPQEPGGEGSEAWLGVSREEDARECIDHLRGQAVDWLVVDHYSLDRFWERRMRTVARGIVAIDDLASRSHDCDVLLDQNYFGASTVARYAGLVEPSCELLLGPQHALLQKDYACLRRLLPKRDGTIRRILVFFGGSDLLNDTSRVLEALCTASLESLAVDVVAGQNHPDRAGLLEWVARRPGAALHERLPSLAGLMARADLAVGGGGSTTWERACLSLPSLVVSLANNQHAFSEALAADGYQILLGRNVEVTASDWRHALEQLVADPKRVGALAQRASTLTEGTGAAALATRMLAGTSVSTPRSPAVAATSNAAGEAARAPLRINVLSDSTSWLNGAITGLVAAWRAEGHTVHWAHAPAEIQPGEVCFILGCSQLLGAGPLAKNAWNLVVHESALPEGRGWSPMTWQVLENRTRVVVSLFEAAATVDSGRIHLQTDVALSGRELIEEWRALQARATLALCRRWVDQFPQVVAGAREQVGTPTYFPRRGPADSRLDPDKSIADQFDLLRTVDNLRYPAFFDLRGARYRLLIERADAADAGCLSTERS